MLKNEQLDIFGNWKSLERIKLEKKCNERYVRKQVKFQRDFVKSGGILSVNKAFVKSN